MKQSTADATSNALHRGLDKRETIIDAKGKRLGRVATEVASVLLGKNSVHFSKNSAAPVSVKVLNASLLKISERRGTDTFQNYSGYPGGRRVETLDHLAKRLGYREVLRRVVSGMLPKNKLHKARMRNLVVTE